MKGCCGTFVFTAVSSGGRARSTRFGRIRQQDTPRLFHAILKSLTCSLSGSAASYPFPILRGNLPTTKTNGNVRSIHSNMGFYASCRPHRAAPTTADANRTEPTTFSHFATGIRSSSSAIPTNLSLVLNQSHTRIKSDSVAATGAATLTVNVSPKLARNRRLPFAQSDEKPYGGSPGDRVIFLPLDAPTSTCGMQYAKRVADTRRPTVLSTRSGSPQIRRIRLHSGVSGTLTTEVIGYFRSRPKWSRTIGVSAVATSSLLRRSFDPGIRRRPKATDRMPMTATAIHATTPTLADGRTKPTISQGTACWNAMPD